MGAAKGLSITGLVLGIVGAAVSVAALFFSVFGLSAANRY